MKTKQFKLFLWILISFLSGFAPTFASESIDSLRFHLKNTKAQQVSVNVDLLVELSWKYRRKSADSTILYAKEALEIASKNQYLNGKAAALKNIGVGYSIKGKIDSAFYFMEASLVTAKEIGDEYLIGRNLNNLGLTHHKQGNYEIALDYYLQSLVISEKIGDATSGVTLMNIGLLQQKTEDYDNALNNFRRALSRAEEESNTTRIASCLYNIGSIYLQRKKFDHARTYYQQALKNAKKNNDLLLISKLLLSIGRVFRKENHQEKAILYFADARHKAQTIDDKETIAQVWSELAVISIHNKNYKNALEQSLKGLEIAEAIKSKEVQRTLIRLVSDSYASLKLYKQAFDYNQRFIQISDELFNREKSRKINTLQISRKIQEKEKKVLQLQAQKIEDEATIRAEKAKYSIIFLIFLLTVLALAFLYSINKSQKSKNNFLKENVAKRTRELELANSELRHSNEELERFAFITSHDLKEPLRNISGFTGLLKRKLRGNLDEEGKTYIKYVQKNTQQMHQLIEDVLEYSRIGKQKENLSMVNLNTVFQKVQDNLSPELASKEKDILAQNLPVIEGFETHLILIFKNLIENGLKYNDSKIAKIEIRAKEHSSYWKFSIQDNGIGIEKEFLEQIFVMFKRLHHRDAYSGSGLGLALVKKVIERIGGRIWIESDLDTGTIVFFTLPKNIPSRKININFPLEMVN